MTVRGRSGGNAIDHGDRIPRLSVCDDLAQANLTCDIPVTGEPPGRARTIPDGEAMTATDNLVC